MGNEKKPPVQTAANEDHSTGTTSESNGTGVAAASKSTQSIESTEIKQESDIKQEPLDMVDIRAANYRNGEHVASSNEHQGEIDFDYLNENKTEVKKKCDKKKDEESKANTGCGGDAMDQREQSEDDLQQPGSRNEANNTKGFDKNPLKKHKCNVCEYSTQRKNSLNRHMLKHTDEKPHECNYCPKKFSRKQYLRAHMKVHVEEFLFKCSGCLQGFDEKDEKGTHEMTCKVIRYECHLCKKSFGSKKYDMMRHMRVHSGDRPFECNECHKKFAQKSSLNNHIELHAGPRLFRCSKCRKRFSREEKRIVHVERCNRQAYECDICGKSFGLNKSHWIRHMRTHTGEKPFQCKECPMKFTQNSNLKAHMKIHGKELPFECLICHRGYSKDNKRKTHQRNCNKLNYECHLCKKFFDAYKTHLISHMHIHSGDKPFQCQLCQTKFAQKRSLKNHINRIHSKNHS